ncbi:sensor domain-containing protein [Gluconobacter morbifer]|uniref:Diguanylate cyclase n=1 Tax=Gluconobacter morbifer G707 TaxID=1088869 RepID=G6XFB4_9PROT|nr:diguanylate cyclase [Gluconobacter morbifer]EHH68872.1 hypothetical protein GMO_01790 [Gluconobacter morbifer G707]
MKEDPDQFYENSLIPLRSWAGGAHDSFVLHALNCSAIVAVTDTKGIIQSVNEKFVQISGYVREELIGNDHRMLRSGRHDRNFFRTIYRTIAQGKVWHGEICNRRKDGSFYWVDTTIVPRRSGSGKITNYVAIRFDITSRKTAEEKLRKSRKDLLKAANTDSLTQIPNRHHFTHKLRKFIRADGHRFVCLALLDIDFFKTVNDTSGHASGDRLLQKFSRQLQKFQNDDCFIGRIGGDEFALLMKSNDVTEFQPFLEKVLSAVRFRFRTRDMTHYCSASIGYAYAEHTAAKEKELLKCADLALYVAKRAGKNRVQHYKPDMKSEVERETTVKKAVADTLRPGGIHFLYYPVFSPATRSISFEIRAYWPHIPLLPGQGDISSLVSEDLHLSPLFHILAFQRIVQDIQYLAEQNVDFSMLILEVDVSVFQNQDFIRNVCTLLENNTACAAKVLLSIKGKSLPERINRSMEDCFRRLRASGVHLMLDADDFSMKSLFRLRALSFEWLKLPSFIFQENSEDLSVLGNIIDIIHKVGMKSAIGGIETQSDYRKIVALGCDYIQGSFLYPPLSREDIKFHTGNILSKDDMKSVLLCS